MTFASDADPYTMGVVITVLGGVITACVATLTWVIRFILKKVVPAIDNLADSTDKNTKAVNAVQKTTKSADKYLKERNGRDNETHSEMIEAIKKIPAQIIATANITAKTLEEHPVDGSK
jgi:hypothetical protein